MKTKEERPLRAQQMIEDLAAKMILSREAKQMSQLQLAQAMGCSLRYVKRMESADVDFRLNTLWVLYKNLGITIQEGPVI